MKYIRTKDGIYETITQNLYKNDDLLYIDGYNLKRVINQADTIEELCDEFVVVVCPDEPCVEIKPEIYKRSFKDILKVCEEDMIGIQKLYGAIWTDKGLQFVALMNEKGELELL